MNSEADLIVPDWPAPDCVWAMSTTRSGGFSLPPWDSFNLGGHVGDDPAHVEKNRLRLAELTHLPRSDFRFMDQVHGTDIEEFPGPERVQADGCVTSQARVPCLVMTADCLPVLFCNRDGNRVAAAHAGWRGLCQGVLECAVARFDDPASVMAWLGPAIGPRQFEVGAEVRERFVERDPEAARAFVPGQSRGRFLADLYQLARQRLQTAGVTQISGGYWCTFSDADRFFSYRRDGVSGRMASLIFIDPSR
ncbi:peptidoglycan editing factor PgeF [Marinobacter halotolerans]|uniref:peptidoglycan editing factor PgeF n=1 Tax=Marinobacter halotolerans TaxID=1569211 RepID=UPI0012491BF8|nr:peptidoglycan editing factor PgeF [Marinobacter halotolerans]